ncbi:MAG: DUF1598 domain-containing protein [Proteobacteria bacterium]|nr:DUF1598 domain-containing protein [Pseudomonadota bacterium]
MIREIKQTISTGSGCNGKTHQLFPSLATFFMLTFFSVLFSVTIWLCPSPAAAGSLSYKGQHIAFSMRVLAKKGSGFSSAANSLCGVSKIEGFVVDGDNQDIIIIGQQSGSHPQYHLDDLVVNMRTIWNKTEALYCSLDPRPQDVRNVVQILSENANAVSPEERRRVIQRVKEVWGSQSVRIGGIPRESRHAHIMIDADYHMKKVSLDLIKLAGISSYLERKALQGEESLREGKDTLGSDININRFWFHMKEGYPTFREAGGIVWLEESPVVLFTAKQNATQTGELYDSQEDDLQAVAFAENFSERFDQAAAQVPSYASLRNLYRLRALLQTMYNMNAVSNSGFDMGFYLNRYRYQMERSMPDSFPGLVTHKETYVDVSQGFKKWSFPIMYGGVNMEMDITEEQFQADDQLSKVREAVLSARPALDSLSWTFRWR